MNATYNSNKGVTINNTFSPGGSPVTLKGMSTFNYNANLGGLIIHANGQVVTNGLNAYRE